METDLDIKDDFHGSDGPMPVRRRQSAAWADLQRAFHGACLEAGFGVSHDTNGPNPSGVGVGPTNTGDHEIRMSAAITHLNPMRHRLNLTVRGNVYVRNILFEGSRAVGVEAESGGEVFSLRSDRIVLSAGAIRSPQLLMLSGVGPRVQLDRFGIPVIHELPGVGQSLWNHLTAEVTYKVKDGKTITSGLDAPHFSLHCTSQEYGETNDMSLRTGPVIDERTERVAGVRNIYRTGDVPPERAARLLCTLGLPEGSGYVKLASAEPSVQPAFNYCYLQHPSDMRRVREGVRFGINLLESEPYKEVFDHVISPTEDILVDDDALDLWIRQTVATSRHLAGTCRMGPDSDEMAVVDQYCRVKGVQKLWVADASVTPRIPRSGGLYATVLMIGERVVDWIAAG